MFWIFAIAMLGMGFITNNNDNRNYSTTTVNNNYSTTKIEVPKGIFGALPLSKGAEVKAKTEEVLKEREEKKQEARASAVEDAK